jgi:UrcA family protein
MTTKTSNSIRSLLGRAVLAASVLSASFGVAHAAAPADAQPATVVAYGDLDLNTEAGARALYSRIAAAAERVCPYQDPRDLARFAQFRSCRNAAIERAVSEVKSSQLAALRAVHVKRG